jgi:hypothetical protein
MRLARRALYPSVLAALHSVNAVLIAWVAFRMARTDISIIVAGE